MTDHAMKHEQGNMRGMLLKTRGKLVWTNFTALITGTVVILLSLPRGRIRERYALWDRLIV